MAKPQSREEWLNRAVNVLAAQVFKPQGVTLPKTIRVSTGWPRKVSKGSIGWCYKTTAAADESTNIFVSPEVAEPRKVLAILVHELIHASDNCASKHSGYFAKTHKAVGLVDKPTTCVPGPELAAVLAELAGELGTYPHATLTHESMTKTQTTRMLKLTCRDDTCGCIVRTTSKWLEAIGAPSCACGSGPMLTDEELEIQEFLEDYRDGGTRVDVLPDGSTVVLADEDEEDDPTEAAHWAKLDAVQYGDEFE